MSLGFMVAVARYTRGSPAAGAKLGPAPHINGRLDLPRTRARRFRRCASLSTLSIASTGRAAPMGLGEVARALRLPSPRRRAASCRESDLRCRRRDHPLLHRAVPEKLEEDFVFSRFEKVMVQRLERRRLRARVGSPLSQDPGNTGEVSAVAAPAAAVSTSRIIYRRGD
jgi:hypothetical protein